MMSALQWPSAGRKPECWIAGRAMGILRPAAKLMRHAVCSAFRCRVQRRAVISLTCCSFAATTSWLCLVFGIAVCGPVTSHGPPADGRGSKASKIKSCAFRLYTSCASPAAHGAEAASVSDHFFQSTAGK